MWHLRTLSRRFWSSQSSSRLIWRALSAASPPLPTKKEDTAPKPSLVPGLGLSAAVATVGFTTANVLSTSLGVPLSGIPVSIGLGLALRNTLLTSQHLTTLQPGLTTATKTVLQGGIVCVAAKLSVIQVLASSAASIPVVVGAVGAGLVLIPRLGRLAGLAPATTLLLTAGTSICGVTAITALAPAIQAPPRDVAVAVANTVAFGTVGMLVYPYLLHSVLGDTASTAVGMTLGVAIHDTSQVLGAALSYKETFGDEVAFQTAAVTKLLRNLGLAVAIPTLTYAYHKEQQAMNKEAVKSDGNDETSSNKSPATMSGLNTFSKYVPPFLYAFLAMSAVRSVGDVVLTADTGHALFSTTMNLLGNDVSKYALGTAMAAVGLSTSASSLRGVGWQPFAVGGAGALAVGGTGLAVTMAVM